MQVRFLAWLLTNAVAVAVAAWIFDGIWFDGPTSGTEEIKHKFIPLLLVALIMGSVNAVVRPVITLLSIPFVIVTLGLFLFLINAAMLQFTDWLAGLFGIGFHVDGFWTAIGGAIVITIVTWAMDRVLADN